MLWTPGGNGELDREALGPEHLHASLQALVVGEDVGMQSGGNCTDENVYRTALDAVIPAKVKQAGGFDKILGSDLFVTKWIE